MSNLPVLSVGLHLVREFCVSLLVVSFNFPLIAELVIMSITKVSWLVLVSILHVFDIKPRYCCLIFLTFTSPIINLFRLCFFTRAYPCSRFACVIIFPEELF